MFFLLPGTDVKPVRVVEVSAGGIEKQQAVNLSKPHERHPSGGWIYQQPSLSKPHLEVGVLEAKCLTQLIFFTIQEGLGWGIQQISSQ